MLQSFDNIINFITEFFTDIFYFPVTLGRLFLHANNLSGYSIFFLFSYLFFLGLYIGASWNGNLPIITTIITVEIVLVFVLSTIMATTVIKEYSMDIAKHVVIIQAITICMYALSLLSILSRTKELSSHCLKLKMAKSGIKARLTIKIAEDEWHIGFIFCLGAAFINLLGFAKHCAIIYKYEIVRSSADVFKTVGAANINIGYFCLCALVIALPPIMFLFYRRAKKKIFTV